MMDETRARARMAFDSKEGFFVHTFARATPERASTIVNATNEVGLRRATLDDEVDARRHVVR